MTNPEVYGIILGTKPHEKENPKLRNHLADFINWLNFEVGGEGPLPLDSLPDGTFGTAMENSINRHYAENRQRGGVRMSNMGKPAIILALNKLGYEEPEPKGKLRYTFLTGDFFENWLEIMMRVYGIVILDSQPECKHFGITGHADYVIESPLTGDPLIVEAKTMSAGYAGIFSSKPNDDRGYVTQLAMYSAALDMDATWVCINKGTSEIFEVPQTSTAKNSALSRAWTVLKALENIHTIDDVLDHVKAPPTRAEVFQKQETGKQLLNQDVAWSPFKSAIHVLEYGTNGYGKPTVYSTRPADAEHMKRELDRLVEEGELLYVGG